MSGDALATYGPMDSLRKALGAQAPKWEGRLATTQGAGNPSLDVAIEGLAGVVASTSERLGSASRTAATGVQTVSEHFAVADA